MLSIFTYMNYRHWLKDVFLEKQRKNSQFSHRQFAEKLDIDPSLLTKILASKRHLGPNTIRNVCEYLKLESEESEYLSALIHLSKSKKENQQREAFEKVQSLRKIQDRVLLSDEYSFYSEWYHVVIRNLLQFIPFYGNSIRAYQHLGKQLSPPISGEQAKQSVELLLSLGLVEIDPTGRHILTELAVSTGDEWFSLAIQSYQKDNIIKAAESFERHPREDRNVSGITMNISAEDLKVINEKIKDIRRDIIRYVNSEATPERVYQLNFQLFPMSQPIVQEKERKGDVQ
jgi:uncharacterized protein (TIGR02147 family)